MPKPAARLRVPQIDPRRRRPPRVEPILPVVPAGPPVRIVEHALSDELPRWGSFRTRGELRRDPAFRRRRREIESVLTGWEWDVTRTQSPAGRDPTLRAVAWNIERGKRFEPLVGALREHPELSGADLVLLTEVDDGMGRSDNRHVARELGERLGMGWVFAPSHIVLAPGDHGEQDHGKGNTRSLHGAALLSRYPIRRVCGVPVPEYFDKFQVLEKRLGDKRAIVAEIELPDGPLCVATVHLDPFAPPRHRARQLRMVLDTVRRFGIDRVLLGGDFNTTTYDLGSALGLAVDVAHKLVRFGFGGTIQEYMTPERVFERRIFDVLAAAELSVQGFTEPGRGTIYYDTNDPELIEKSRDYLPPPVLRWLMRRLEPWHGTVPMRMDWFAGRRLDPLRCRTVERPRYKGMRISDHNPLVVDVRLES
jgi:endonuclease/exonuclease/phosphatase family metal-dependent hydrolase